MAKAKLTQEENEKSGDEAVGALETTAQSRKTFKVYDIDYTGGKVHFEGEEGDRKKVCVNGKTREVEIVSGLGIFAFGASFNEYPAVVIND